MEYYSAKKRSGSLMSTATVNLMSTDSSQTWKASHSQVCGDRHWEVLSRQWQERPWGSHMGWKCSKDHGKQELPSAPTPFLGSRSPHSTNQVPPMPRISLYSGWWAHNPFLDRASCTCLSPPPPIYTHTGEERAALPQKPSCIEECRASCNGETLYPLLETIWGS